MTTEIECDVCGGPVEFPHGRPEGRTTAYLHMGVVPSLSCDVCALCREQLMLVFRHQGPWLLDSIVELLRDSQARVVDVVYSMTSTPYARANDVPPDEDNRRIFHTLDKPSIPHALELELPAGYEDADLSVLIGVERVPVKRSTSRGIVHIDLTRKTETRLGTDVTVIATRAHEGGYANVPWTSDVRARLHVYELSSRRAELEEVDGSARELYLPGGAFTKKEDGTSSASVVVQRACAIRFVIVSCSDLPPGERGESLRNLRIAVAGEVLGPELVFHPLGFAGTVFRAELPAYASVAVGATVELRSDVHPKGTVTVVFIGLSLNDATKQDLQ